ncbi:MAG TPA: helix-turn-helix transcriptional regulator [Polyangiaceae bacterium]|nr:helix-turn-helix transcriptional regulator [Polyangiaceae bacterium]
MATRKHLLPVSVPGFRALRWSSDELYCGMKETYTITRVVAGRASFATRGKVWSSAAGSLRIQEPGDVVRDLARDGRATYQIVAFPPRTVDDLNGKVNIYSHLEAGDPRGAPFHRLHDAVQAGAGRLALEVAIAEALSAFGTLRGAKCDYRRPVRRAIELLRDRLDTDLDLDTLAQHAGTDKFHLCRAFRTQVGLPPHAYLTRLRIMRAKELLAAGVRPSDIAPRVGLYDQSQLNRHFRRIVGTTPGAYARELNAP